MLENIKLNYESELKNFTKEENANQGKKIRQDLEVTFKLGPKGGNVEI